MSEPPELCCPNCGSIVKPEEFDSSQVGFRLNEENSSCVECIVCHYQIGTIIWDLSFDPEKTAKLNWRLNLHRPEVSYVTAEEYEEATGKPVLKQNWFDGKYAYHYNHAVVSRTPVKQWELHGFSPPRG